MEARSGIARSAVFAASLLAASVLLSGPIGLYIVALVHPQPNWVDAGTFAANYAPIQGLPYYFGFLLIIGSILFVSSNLRMAGEPVRSRMMPAVPFVGAYGALIALNYWIQIGIVPSLIKQPAIEPSSMLALLTMANPASPTWLLEMLGYAFQGLAFACLMPGLGDWRFDPLLKGLLVCNAVVSLVSPLLSVVQPTWVASTAGWIGFLFWNLLVFAIALLFGIRGSGRVP